MKRTKKLLSFFLAIVMVITAFAVVPFSTTAANFNDTKTFSSRIYVAGHDASSNRYNKTSTGSLTVCNDGEASNFSSGAWYYDISNVPGSIKTITATVSVNVESLHTEYVDVSIYAVYNNPGNSSSVGNSVSNALGRFTAKDKLGTLGINSTTHATGVRTFDIAECIKKAKTQYNSVFGIYAVMETAGQTNSTGGWTDTSIAAPTLTINAVEKVYSTTASADVNENSSTGRVVLDDAIYTFASESAYYNYGTNISTLDPWDTQVIFKSGSASDVASIICLDSGAELSLNGTNKLQGNLITDNFKVSNAETGVNATLLFTFNDGTKEYHRVAVKSYPVENHIMASSEYHPTFGGWKESGYTMFMRGSTGSNGMSNLGVWKYYKNYFKSNKDAHGFPDQDNNSYTTGKKAQTFKWVDSGGAATDASLATYYIDKSCRDTSWAGLGNSELWDGTNYNISIEVVRTRFKYPIGSGWDFALNNMPVQGKLVRTDNNGSEDTNGTTYGLKFTHNASVSASDKWTNASDNTCNVRVAVKASGGGYAVLRTNMVVKLFDKSTARSKYNELINKKLVESNYTASSFATYQNALMAMEAYLSNYENTTAISTSDSIYTALVNAYNGLAPRATEAEYQELLTLDQQLKTAKSYVSSEPIDRPYTNTSYNNFKGALITDPTGQAEQDLAAYQAGTKDLRDFAQSTYTTYKNAYNSVLGNLVERADFRYYDEQADAVAGNLTNYTTKDGQYIRLYSVLQPYESITLYTDAQKIETPKTSQTTVNNVGSAIANANTGVYNSNPVDQSALTSFTTEFANFDTDVYTESVVNAKVTEAAGLSKSITFNGTQYFGLDVANQADLDNKLTSYLNAINDSINTYNVTVPSTVTATASYVATATDNGDNTKTYAYPLGTNVTFTNGNADTAWYMAVQSNNTTRGQQYQTYGKSFATKVVGNLTITAEYAVADSTPYYVAIIREYDNAGAGKAIDRVNYVANNSTYTLPTPTKIANYNFAGYVVNGETKAAGDTVTITADTEIAAKYQYVGSDLTVTVNGTAKTYAYNESVTVRASGAYAWVEKTGADTWRPFYIGSAVTFRATESTELKSVTEAEFNAMFTAEAFAPILRQNGVLVDADNRAVFHAQRIDYLPAGAQVVEFGILMNTASSTDFDLGNDKGVGEKNEKTVRLKSTQSLDKVQFNIFVKNAGDKAFTYRSYMIYKLADGTVETVYSDVETKA